ncbi:DUF3850 domain-containing protein [Enterococcus sp. BWM-S5]|uniref:DUF3850 domain-containing protein n=2 Tax=Enterococcus larvae TaxID=2794352 RepID=A0ABS4CKP8_9ENTE|nr:DUF3850 domain-containing protein [Enterococcus larvae]
MIITIDGSTIEYLEKMYQRRGFTVHKIKTESEHFEQTVAGLKPFETRLNDRNYKIGDICIQCEWKNNEYTGRYLIGCIIYMNNFKLQEGYITFTFEQF